MKEWIGEARTADRAIARGLAKLGLRRDQVDVRELGERKSGLLSLFGFHSVKVRVTERVRKSDRFDYRDRDERPERGHRKSDRSDSSPRRSTPEARRSGPRREETHRSDDSRREERGREEHRRRDTREQPRPAAAPHQPKPRPEPHRTETKKSEPRPPRPAPPPPERPAVEKTPRPFIPPETLLIQWKELFGWEDLEWTFQPLEGHRQPVLLKTINGARFAGGGGRGLEALEYLFNTMSSGGDREKPWVAFRLEGLPTAEEGRVVDQALFAAFQVRRTGKVFHLGPMPPDQRRMVHQTLANHPDVETGSEGDGPSRHVVVRSRAKPEEPAPWSPPA